MAEYLTKEEIKQWRSSLEKITLEEFAARLGKSIEEAKPTNDVVDMVMNEEPKHTTIAHQESKKQDKFSSIAERAFERERQLSHTPFSISKPIAKKTVAEPVSQKAPVLTPKVEKKSEVTIDSDFDEIHPSIVLRKELTERERVVLCYLSANVGKPVYAKDLAALLELPRDYIYKYIKNLRAKIEGERLQNCPGGGFILTV